MANKMEGWFGGKSFRFSSRISLTFKTAIQQFGRTVIILSPWNNPLPLTRVWCLWEIYSTASTNTTFEVAMPDEEQQNFLNALALDFGQINAMLTRVDIRNSEAWKEEDKERIFEVVKAMVGFTKLNQLIFNHLRQWLLGSARQELEHRHQEIQEKEKILSKQEQDSELQDLKVSTLALTSNIASLLKDQGKYDESLKLLVHHSKGNCVVLCWLLLNTSNQRIILSFSAAK
eukprot:Lithocolla_globosa_v1_NODE_1242_length_2746_cov_3.366035.p2 type:complete len:231 gc:universal NODE_1242_length_2746_cov_3.366035:1460-768(-)